MTKPSNKAKINVRNIGRFLQGYRRMFSDTFGMLEKYKQEQVVWRSQQAFECTKNGSCVFCGCTTPAKYYSDEGCEDPIRKCYPPMADEETWNKFKNSHNIAVHIK
jgi:hypothetical protein